MPEIFHQVLWRQGGQVVRTPGLQSGGPGSKPSTLPLTGLFLNGSLSSAPWLSFVYSQLQPAASQLGFLHPMFIYNVWDQIVRIGPEMSPVGSETGYFIQTWQKNDKRLFGQKFISNQWPTKRKFRDPRDLLRLVITLRAPLPISCTS